MNNGDGVNGWGMTEEKRSKTMKCSSTCSVSTKLETNM